MRSLILTLGHNSSAIFVDDGNILMGYEEERLSGIKSDSAFPYNAIKKIVAKFNPELNIPICVSHWFLDGQLPTANKYWDPEFLEFLFPRARYHIVDPVFFTHHDAHKLSAEIFAGSDFPEDHHTLVVDGFGTEGECYSIYHKGTLVYRLHGFMLSVGLFYQYATAFCGMKMHQHEYKMLAYETHITEIIDEDEMPLINKIIDDFSNELLANFDKEAKRESKLVMLEGTKVAVYAVLQVYLKCAMTHIIGKYDDKILVSYFVQRHAENVIKWLVSLVNPTNLLVVGGTFFNVKINSMLADLVPGKFCAMPLAGDQGAGLGVYQYYCKDLKWPEHLFWGKRPEFDTSDIPGIIITSDPYSHVKAGLKRQGIVNLVRGAMEYGPRALCNTSTLALPNLENAEIINEMNDRTNEMPFALVVTEDQAFDLFEDINKIHKSLDYMIVTRRFKRNQQIGLEGGAHYYPLDGVYTCRPQIVHDPLMITLLQEFGPLINTSFNCHGNPIVYDGYNIKRDHEFQRKTFKITTVIEGGDYVQS